MRTALDVRNWLRFRERSECLEDLEGEGFLASRVGVNKSKRQRATISFMGNEGNKSYKIWKILRRVA